MKFVKWLAKATGWLLAHTFEAMITGITTIAAFASLYLPETMTEKILYFFGFLVLGFVISIGLARLRGEDKE